MFHVSFRFFVLFASKVFAWSLSIASALARTAWLVKKWIWEVPNKINTQSKRGNLVIVLSSVQYSIYRMHSRLLAAAAPGFLTPKAAVSCPKVLPVDYPMKAPQNEDVRPPSPTLGPRATKKKQMMFRGCSGNGHNEGPCLTNCCALRTKTLAWVDS